MQRIDAELDIDADGEVCVVTRMRLGHIADVDPDLIPDKLRAEFTAELDAYRDGEREAQGVRDAAGAAWDDRWGSFDRKLVR